MTETLNTFKKIVSQLDSQTRENLSSDITRVTIALATPAADVMRQCGDDFWGECKQFPKGDWRIEVENNDTVLGYWDWIVHQAETNEVSLKSLSATKKAEKPPANQENSNHTEIAAEYGRLRSVAPSWTPSLLRESVIDTFSIKWGMFKDEVTEIVDSYFASGQREISVHAPKQTEHTIGEGGATASKAPDIETLIAAALQHGQSPEAGHEACDLQDYIRAGWTLLTTDQRKLMLMHPLLATGKALRVTERILQNEGVETLLDIFQEYGNDKGEKAEISVLQDALRACWAVLTPGQRTELFELDSVQRPFENATEPRFPAAESTAAPRG